jgi:hypothetical protein
MISYAKRRSVESTVKFEQSVACKFEPLLQNPTARHRRGESVISGGKGLAGEDRRSASVVSADTAILKRLVGIPTTGAWKGHLSAWMRSAGTSTSVTPRKENRSFMRYFGGCSEVCFTI